MPAGCSIFFRLAFFLPVIIAAAFVSIVWSYFYGDDLGVINYYLRRLGLPAVRWLTDAAPAMTSIIIMDVWKNTGFFMVIFIAALQGVPKTIMEAAVMDGTSGLAAVLPHHPALDLAGRLLLHRLRLDRRAAGLRVDHHPDPRRPRRRDALAVDPASSRRASAASRSATPPRSRW